MPTIIEHFAQSKLKEILQAADFESYFGVKLREIPQGPGITGDYWVRESSTYLDSIMGEPCFNKRIEFKYEKKSSQTGNVFCEYEQTSDGGCTFKKSGWVKAIDDGCILVVQLHTNGESPYLLFNEETFAVLLKAAFRQTRTTRCSNGNPVTLHQMGHLIKVPRAIEAARHTFSMAAGVPGL